MDCEFWYKKTEKKFLHNIDTFYYSVKLCQDFTRNSIDPEVQIFRNMVNRYQNMDSRDEITYKEVEWIYPVYYRPGTFDKFYNFILSVPEKFDVCIAPIVPPSESGAGSVTSEMVVMLRAKNLWEEGVNAAFEESLEFIKLLCDRFRLTLQEVKENRVDYCWHTNALQDPETYFRIDNFSRMQVSRFNGATFHYRFKPTRRKGPEFLQLKDDELYESDYIALGKRGDKCFVRIYLKTKEVVEQGYKGFFFYTWFFQGLISRYDLYVLEEAYKKRNWNYVDIARLQFALNYNDELTEQDKLQIRKLLHEKTPDYISIRKTANKYTPALTKILNVEYQTTRRMSKTFQLLKLKDNSDKGAAERIYDLLDNRRLIIKSLTHDTLRLVKVENDCNKSRADYTDFWKRLRSTKIVDVVLNKHNLKLQRKYTSNMDLEIRKKRAVRAVTAFAVTLKRNPENTIYEDAAELLAVLNDNDFAEIYQYKNKYLKQFKKGDELPEVTRYREISIFDQNTGGIY